MSYYADLTPYNYFAYTEKELNVGWLSKDHDFTIGEIPEGFLEKLKVYAEREHRMHQTRGWHDCHFCEENHHGSNELRVVGSDGMVYASPALIIHYVEAHKYLPPQQFIDAVMNGPIPGSDKYKEAIKLLPNFWQQRRPDPNRFSNEEEMMKVMVDRLSEEISQDVIKNLLSENPEFGKFVEAYNKIMPSVYLIDKLKNKS